MFEGEVRFGGRSAIKSTVATKILTSARLFRKDIGDVTAVSGTDGNSGFVYLFRNSSATCMSFVEAHAGHPVSSITFDPISRYIYSGGYDGMLHTWDMKLKMLEGMSTSLNPPERKKLR